MKIDKFVPSEPLREQAFTLFYGPRYEEEDKIFAKISWTDLKRAPLGITWEPNFIETGDAIWVDRAQIIYRSKGCAALVFDTKFKDKNDIDLYYDEEVLIPEVEVFIFSRYKEPKIKVNSFVVSETPDDNIAFGLQYFCAGEKEAKDNPISWDDLHSLGHGATIAAYVDDHKEVVWREVVKVVYKDSRGITLLVEKGDGYDAVVQYFRFINDE